MSQEEREAYAAGSQDAYDRLPRDPSMFPAHKTWLRDAYLEGYRAESGSEF